MFHIYAIVQPVVQKVLAQSTTVTITFSPEQVITWLIIGLIAGLLASMLIRGRRYSFIGSIILGLLGALVGGFLFTILKIATPSFLNGSVTIKLIDVVISFIGAVILLIVFGLFYRRPRV